MTDDALPAPVTLATFTVTCATEGCPNNGQPITVQADAATPYVLCGMCGQQISNVQESS